MREQCKTKKIYLEIIRIFAIILVLFNHTSSFHIPFCQSLPCAEEYCCLLVSVVDKVAVPLFFMVSGALLLHKEEDIRRIMSKRVLRFVIIIILFQIVQHIYSLVVLNKPIAFYLFFLDFVFARSNNPATWFLYAYLAFVLLLPFLRILVKNMRNEHFVYLFVLQLVTWAFIPFSETGISRWLFLCNPVFLYILAGYFLEHRIDINSVRKKHLIMLAFASCICVSLSAAMCQLARLIQGAECCTTSVLCFSGGLLVPCITIYLAIKKFSAKIVCPRTAQMIGALGGATFSIMLCENMLRAVAKRAVQWMIPSGYVYMSDVLIVLLAALIGFALGLLLKRIPFVRSLV